MASFADASDALDADTLDADTLDALDADAPDALDADAPDALDAGALDADAPDALDVAAIADAAARAARFRRARAPSPSSRHAESGARAAVHLASAARRFPRRRFSPSARQRLRGIYELVSRTPLDDNFCCSLAMVVDHTFNAEPVFPWDVVRLIPFNQWVGSAVDLERLGAAPEWYHSLQERLAEAASTLDNRNQLDALCKNIPRDTVFGAAVGLEADKLVSLTELLRVTAQSLAEGPPDSQ